MFRSRVSRLALQSARTPVARPSSAVFRRSASPAQWTATMASLAFKRPQLPAAAQLKPAPTAILRRTLADKIDREAEKKYAKEKLEPTPETVSSTSSMHPILGEVGETPNSAANDVDMMAGIKGDVQTIKETFDLSAVPRQAYYIGLAGVLPYLGTSLATVACAYEINHNVAGYGYVLDAHTAETLLHILEPLQIGYGAVILSFLGAIHWGLEWAKFGGVQGYPRYAIGVIAPAVAWPTMLLPVEYALITQFLAFNFLYLVDTRATYRGWTPSWYAIYRFVLTFIVGASIVISLIGRGEVADRVHRIPGAVDRLTTLRKGSQERLAKEEEGIRAQIAAKEADSKDDSGKKSKAV